MNKGTHPAKKQDKISKEKKTADKALKSLLAKHIQNVRKRRGITARKAAEDIGISRTALTQMETGNNHFNAVTLFRLASALKCDIKEFFPTVPESVSLTDADAANVAQENAQAAELLKKAFPKK
jgi:transcriptional regulator with XRE-family HTH domain